MEDEEVLEGLNEWQQIQSPWHQITCSTTSTTTSPTTNTHGNDSSAVVIRDNYLNNDSSVFHPSNHEDLPIPPQNYILLDTREQSHSSNSSLSSSDSRSNEDDDEVGPVRVLGTGNGRCWRLNLGLLSSGIVRVALTIRNFAVSRGGFWSFVCVTGVLVVYARLQRWRRRVLQKNEDRLMLLIRERDQKISQLLLQMAQMNEVLSGPRKVKVYRVE